MSRASGSGSDHDRYLKVFRRIQTTRQDNRRAFQLTRVSSNAFILLVIKQEGY